MTACYYCGGRARGCAECNANSRAGGKVAALLDEIHERTEEELKPKKLGPAPDGSLLMPTSVQRADGTWHLVDMKQAKAELARVERHPIKVSAVHDEITTYADAKSMGAPLSLQALQDAVKSISTPVEYNCRSVPWRIGQYELNLLRRPMRLPDAQADELTILARRLSEHHAARRQAMLSELAKAYCGVFADNDPTIKKD